MNPQAKKPPELPGQMAPAEAPPEPELSPEQPGPEQPGPSPQELVQQAIEAAQAHPGAGVAGDRPALPKRRPAEFSAFVTAAAALAAYFGVDHAAGILYAGLGVAATLPFAVSSIIDTWRSVLGGPSGR